MSGFSYDDTELCDPCFTLWMDPPSTGRKFTFCPNCPGKTGGKRWEDPGYCKTPAWNEGRSAHRCSNCSPTIDEIMATPAANLDEEAT